MPIHYDPADFQAFFGATPTCPDEGEFAERLFELSYSGHSLKYTIMMDVVDEYVYVSGCVDLPFGADSLFEIPVPCDSITRTDDGYHPGQIALWFWYDLEPGRPICTMQLLKRTDGNLKVWPGCVWPRRHPMFGIQRKASLQGKERRDS